MSGHDRGQKNALRIHRPSVGARTVRPKREGQGASRTRRRIRVTSAVRRGGRRCSTGRGLCTSPGPRKVPHVPTRFDRTRSSVTNIRHLRGAAESDVQVRAGTANGRPARWRVERMSEGCGCIDVRHARQRDLCFAWENRRDEAPDLCPVPARAASSAPKPSRCK